MITLESIKEACGNCRRSSCDIECLCKQKEWLIELVENMEQRGCVLDCNAIKKVIQLKADLAKYKKLEDAAREVYNAYIEATPHDTDFDWGSWGNKMDKALKELGEAR